MLVKKTRIFTTGEADIKEAAQIIKNGGLVAFPTETVYGLGADALDAAAVGRIYEAKGRPSDNPMIVHIAKAEDLEKLAYGITDDVRKLMDELWPGPLTMILRKRPEVPDRTTGGLDTVAVRMPDSATALRLIELSGCPIAAPSANISGRPSPTRASDVVFDMDGRIDGIIEGGDCRVGIESTVIDMTEEEPVILRPGMITADRVSAILGKRVTYDRALSKRPDDSDFRPKSPGMKYRHYAPKAEMLIVDGDHDKVAGYIEKLRTEKEAEGIKTGVVLFEDDAFEEAAHELFSRLRDLDAAGVDLIIAGALRRDDQEGLAVMNRMFKSAGYNVVRLDGDGAGDGAGGKE